MYSKNRLNFGIIGCGRIAKRHSDLLGQNQIAYSNLTAVCDLNLDKAKNIGKKYIIPYYQNMHEMIKNEDLDVLVVFN